MDSERILQAGTLLELLNSIRDFCRDALLRDDDKECMELKEKVEASDKDYLVLLSSYFSVCEDGDDVVDALYEFLGNCSGFEAAGEESTKQITKAEFETVLDEREEKCGLRECIEQNHILRVAEADAISEEINLESSIHTPYINLLLPRIDLNTDAKEYISGELGVMLYDVLKIKISPETIKFEMNRYIPESRNTDLSVKQLFKKYFYSVVLYKERKPGIYKNYDKDMVRVIVLEFFKRIIGMYLRE